MPRRLPAFALLLAFATLTAAQKPTDAEQAAARAQVEKGLKVDVWAAEPLLANPVVFAFDEKGRCFVVETHRLHAGVTDTRNHMYWLDDDLAIRSVADRLAMYAKHKYPPSPEAGEKLRVLWDSTGSGKADKSEVFAGPFNKPEDGLAAGVLPHRGDVFFTCIPSIYKFRGDTKATETKVLATGFGLHVQFIGHDMHGLVMGPDGKLYFSIGDRGLNVTTKEGKKLFNPDSGAVLRCDPDGANLEIVHVGLRNPQELAFDDLGNLFTYDNNSDSGDRARWVQIVEGGDSGWRCGYQYGTLMHPPGVPQGNRGPWNAEKIWHVPGPDGGPPAYVVPPLANFGNGPSGICFYPGVGLSERYKGHFFACDFTSNAGSSVIWSLAVKPKGASFEVTDLHPFVKNMVPTDCDFGPDGAFYWSDWLGGWGLPGKGRIFRVTDPEAMKDPAVAEAKKLLAEGFGKKSVADLLKLLEHPHRQVRQEAQFALIERLKRSGNGSDEIKAVSKVATESRNKFATIHALRCLAATQPLGFAISAGGDAVVRAFMEPYNRPLAIRLGDPDPDVRSEALRFYRRAGFPGMISSDLQPIIARLRDQDARVRFVAAETYSFRTLPGKDFSGYLPLFDLLKENDNADAYLRHAAVAGLARMTAKPCDLITAFEGVKARYDTPAVRLGLVLALRKLQCPKLGDFLADADPTVAAEAARAIYDQDLTTPMPELAKLAEKPNVQEPVAYRALAANYKLGTPEHAARVAAFAARPTEPAHLREFALKLLADWPKPARRDPIVGTTQALEPRDPAVVAAAVRPVLPKLFAGSAAVRKETVQLVAKLGLADVGPLMARIVTDDKQPAGLRADALFALEGVKAKELADAAKAAQASGEPKLRAAAVLVNARANPAAAATALPALVRDPKASAAEKQAALDAMAALKESADVDAVLAELLDTLAAGKLPPELQLDVLETARARSTARNLKLHAPLKEKLTALDAAANAAKDPLAKHRDALAGGDAERGRAVVLASAAVYCQRCHKIEGQGGEVGPPLDGVGAKQTREYLLESIVLPSAKIAEGYQSVILQTVDGKTVTGVLRAKDAKGYTVVTADNKVVTVPKDDVESEKPDKSAMPDDLHTKLSKRELRDVVEFLASLKEPAKK